MKTLIASLAFAILALPAGATTPKSALSPKSAEKPPLMQLAERNENRSADVGRSPKGPSGDDADNANIVGLVLRGGQYLAPIIQESGFDRQPAGAGSGGGSRSEAPSPGGISPKGNEY